MKPKTCKWCKQRFVPIRQKQVCCAPECAESYSVKVRYRQEKINALESRKTLRLKLEKLKSRSQWLREAQSAFNRFIRERDKGKPCICCGKPLETVSGSVGGAYDAGHYRSVGSAPHLRFNENNCHAQRKQCNSWGNGRAVDYRIGLIKRIGLEEVSKLEADQEPKKYTIEELKEIISTYKQKLKELKRDSSLSRL